MPPNIALNRNGLTWRLVMSVTPDITKVRARNVKVSLVRAVPSEHGVIAYMATTCTIKNDDGTAKRDGKLYTTTITVRDRNGHIHVDCECAYHPFWGAEVALSLRKAADIVRSNGALPRARNPDMEPWVCKHAAALISMLVQRGKLK